ncbi:serine hydrolase domain-containing protein [Brevundimonas sp. 2R-24]|uniref:Serine hydrolase domain-containing protein n=1 Tax=Peiella sedimenti TaxID=3061083 RepID=A0ABT8SHW2_9CAUL|nr:serine hydrolase domain-containing protein [Caulobacteraceae bacterium XZ-24]
MIWLRTLAVAVAALSLTAPAASAVPAEPSRADEAQAILARILERDGTPGVMAAVYRNGELIWSGATGLADIENRAPLTPTTRMRIGSVSKPLTAVLALRLRDQGRLDLDADVRALVTELPEPTDGIITARRLAAHTAGVRQYDFRDIQDANNFLYYPNLTAALARTVGDPLVSAPGAAHHYSSLGYNILGILAERAAAAEFGELIGREVAAPLGLENTMIDHPLAIISGRTRFYTRFPDGVVRNTIWRDSSDFYPSGGLLSTAEDLARFGDAVFSGSWLSEASMRDVLTEATTIAGEGVGYSFGWQIGRRADGSIEWYGHGGETNGAYASLRYYPDEKLTVAVITNANAMSYRPYFFEAARTELPAVFGHR